MAAGKISIQANDGKVAGVVFEDGASSNVTVSVPKEGGNVVTDKDATVTSNLNMVGTGLRITGDFSNVTDSNRTAFQTSTTNGNTLVSAIPNGTSTTSALGSFNNQDVNNSSVGYLSTNASAVRIISAKTGTGTALPITFSVDSSECMRIDSSGNVVIGSTADNNTRRLGFTTGGGGTSAIESVTIAGAYQDLVFKTTYGTESEKMRLTGLGSLLLTSGTGGLGYGTGSGGTVTQLTSKSTSVTLNKPSGKIIMHNAALAAGASVMFQVNCSVCSHYDVPIVTGAWTIVLPENYRIEATKISYPGGAFFIKVTNVSGTSLSEELTINFAIIKGANA